jgi:hypothetical protein
MPPDDSRGANAVDPLVDRGYMGMKSLVGRHRDGGVQASFEKVGSRYDAGFSAVITIEYEP